MRIRDLRQYGRRYRSLILLTIALVFGLCVLRRPAVVTVADGFDWVHLPAELRVMPTAEGWRYRVIRSIPRLASGDLSSLPASAKDSATLFRTMVLADATGDDDRGYRLRRVGVGNAVPFEGEEVVVTNDGPESVLSRLSTLERIVLRVAESKLDQATIEVRTPTFAVMRTPARLLLRGKHNDVDLRYAMLIDPKSGRLQTLIWSAPAGSHEVPECLLELGDGTFDCALDIVVSTRIGPIPVAWSFAMRSLPEGRPLTVPPRVASEIEALERGEGDPVGLERELIRLLKSEPKS